MLTNQWVSEPLYDLKIISYARISEDEFEVYDAKLVRKEGEDLKLAKYRAGGMVILNFILSITCLSFLLWAFPNNYQIVPLLCVGLIVVCAVVTVTWFKIENSSSEKR